MKRIAIERRLTPVEVATYNAVREQVAKELPQAALEFALF